MNFRPVLSVAGLALWLGGCAGMVVVHQPMHTQRYLDGDFEYAARSGEMRTSVHGNPFAIAPQSFNAAVTGTMRGANTGPDVVFTPTPEGEGSGAFHVVLMFDPPVGTFGDDLCADAGAIHPVAGNGGVRLLSAFCVGDQLLSTVGGSVSGVDGPRHPKFRELVRQVTMHLFPAYDHWDIGGEGSGSKTN